MSLRLIYGRAGTGKSTFCMNEIKSKLKDGEDNQLVLIVPEQFSLQAERKLVDTVDTGGVMRAEVLSFRRMAYRVFNQEGGFVRRHINSAGKCMLIYRIVERLKDSLSFFSNSLNQKGFVNTICDTIAELKRYNVTPGSLETVGHSLEVNRVLKDKLDEICLIYSEYEKELHQKYMDSDDELALLIEKLRQSRQFAGSEIWIDEFSGFTPQEYKVIEELLYKSERVSICLCTDCLIDEKSIECSDVFAPVKRTAEKLMNMAKAAGVRIEEPVVPGYRGGRFENSVEIGHLERNFFSFPYEAFMKKTKDISIFSAVNIFSEVENTARDIVRLCRDKGMRYGQIAVVTRDLATYEKLVSSIFAEYDIPFFIDRKKDIITHPLIQLVLSAIDIFIRNWSYESVFRYLKTGLTGLPQDDIDVIENYVLAFGIRGGMWTKNGEWNYKTYSEMEYEKADEQQANVIERVNRIRMDITDPLLELYAKLKGRRNVRENCTALYEFLCRIGIPERTEHQVEVFKERGEIGYANEYSRIWNMVMEVLDQIVEVMGNNNLNITEFRKILEIGVGEYNMGLIPPTQDQVLVGSVERSKSHDISALYIVGVNDGVFPAASFCEGVLSDKDREVLRASGLELAQDTRTIAFEEQFLTYSAITTAGLYLRLSYPIADHEGKTMRPSTIISRVRKVFPNITECSNIAVSEMHNDSIEMVTRPLPTFNELVCRMRDYAEGIEVSPIWRDVYKWYSRDERWEKKRDSIMTGLFYSNRAGKISKRNTDRVYKRPVYTSVSKLESFAACPFSYYVKYGLKARERKVFKLNAPDVGTFMHSIIDRFSKSLQKKNMDWRTLDRDWCQKQVGRLVDEMLKSMSRSVFNSSGRYRYLSQRLKRILVRAICIIAEHIKRGSFEPIGYEVIFGYGEEFPPITIELSSGEEIMLTGRVDRIDALKSEEGTYVRVIDYKSGSKAFKLSDVYYGLQIQLITYIDAIMNGMNEWGEAESEQKMKLHGDKILPGGIFYLKIDDPLVKAGRYITEEQVEKAIMKELKMKGIVLADVKLIREMDNGLEGDSLIVPARIKKGDTLGKSSAATIEQFRLIRSHVKKLLSDIANEMLDGNISISPYKINKSTPCKYCEYSSICQFDPGLNDNRYRLLDRINDDDIWNLIENK